jgi:hypothetical protein
MRKKRKMDELPPHIIELVDLIETSNHINAKELLELIDRLKFNAKYIDMRFIEKFILYEQLPDIIQNMNEHKLFPSWSFVGQWETYKRKLIHVR